MNDMINFEAITRAADILERVANPKNFDLSHWACGSVCCTIGHAAQDPWFIEQGFHLEHHDANFRAPVYEGHEHYAAVSVFFGLDFLEAKRLFSSHYYESLTDPAPVIARLRATVELGEVPKVALSERYLSGRSRFTAFEF